jgi:CheY-like chemotaxis protein
MATDKAETRVRVLFVDDEPDVLKALERIFRRERAHWDVRFACSGTAALEELRREGVDVVVSDLRMPVMDGAAFLAAVRSEFPKTIRIVLSGFADAQLLERAWPSSHMMLTKPCEHRSIRDAIVRLVDLAA